MTRKVSVIVFLLAFVHALAFAQSNDQVKLISSNDDYGLELDWMQIFNAKYTTITAQDIAFDKMGNMYISGVFNENLRLNDEFTLSVKRNIDNFFVIKMDPDKNIKWVKVIEPEKAPSSAQTISAILLGDDCLIFSFEVSAMNLYCDSNMIFEYDGDCYEHPYNTPPLSVILKLNTETGELEQSLITKPPFRIDKIAVGKDGNIYLSADMVKDFCGINKDLPSDCRSTGKYDKYFAKLTPDFKLIWDFTINETFPYDEYAKADIGQMLLAGDSMYVIDVYCSDIQINPDKNSPVYAPYVGIEGEEQSYENVLVACYNISGDKPVLDKYQNFDANYIYKCPHIEGLSTDKYGNLYGNLWIRGDGHCGIKFNEDLSFDTIRTLPLGRPATYGIATQRDPWRFNENKNLELNFFAVENDKYVHINDTLSIPFEKGACEGFAKYDSNQNLRYVLYLTEERRSVEQYFTDDNHGGLYFLQESSIHGKNDVNWSLTGHVDVFSDATSSYSVLVKYTETFRIREELSDKGTIRQAGEMVRYGADVKIEALPMQGYQTDSVVTHTGYALAKQTDGTFLLPHVTDRVTLKAYYSPATGVAETDADKALVYPNPATDKIHVTTLECFHYVLTDVKGMRITEGETFDGTVDVTSLAPGLYLLQIDNDKIVRFEKK